MGELNSAAINILEMTLNTFCSRLVNPRVRETALALTDLGFDDVMCSAYRATAPVVRLERTSNCLPNGSTYADAHPLDTALYGIKYLVEKKVGPGFDGFSTEFWVYLNRLIAYVVSADVAMDIIAMLTNMSDKKSYGEYVDSTYNTMNHDRNTPRYHFMLECSRWLDGMRIELLNTLIKIDVINHKKKDGAK